MVLFLSKFLKKLLIICLFLNFISLFAINKDYITILDGLRLSNGEEFTFSGDYFGNISIMYFDQSFMFNSWENTKSETTMIPYNYSRHGYDYEYKVSELDIRVDFAITNNFTIAKNVSEQINLKPAYIFAQEFTTPENITSIEEIMLFLSYNLTSEDLSYYYIDLLIYDETLQKQLDWVWIGDAPNITNDWVSFKPFFQDFEPNTKYNLVLKFWIPGYSWDYQFDFWKAENYTNSSFNKGFTRSYNFTGVYNSTSWEPVSNDSTVDMLCYFTYTEEINWEDINLKFIINDEIIVPDISKVYAFSTYTVFKQLTQDINLTITSDQTLDSLSLSIDIHYIFLIKADATYDVDQSNMEWIVKYYYEAIPFGWPPPQFLFEKDWNLVKLEDPNEIEMTDIYFGPTMLYNESYYGITSFFGPALEEGNYTATFNSPNYCHSIVAKVQSVDDFVIKPSIEIGQMIRLEAEIINSFNQPISGGAGSFMLLNPAGELIYNKTGLNSVNGTIISPEFSITSNFSEGVYEAKIFWTNGKEVAYYTAQIIIVAPINIIFWVIISIVLAAASTPLALVARKYIRQRNWQKSLKDLFIFTKEGLNLYEYSFGIEIQDSALISAMISALTSFVKEATGSKEMLRTIDQEDNKVILYHGNLTTTALMSEKDLPIIHKRVRKFSESFEEEFGLKLKNWKGETTLFKGAEVIVNKYFPIDVEGQIIHGVRGKLLEFRNRLETMFQPTEIISLMREITEFISRYRAIVNKYYIDYYFEIIKIAEDKISSA
jgi:hypothetical protein